MEKNKTGKYLKYAIGEIILVVIGILIALSINNWNEEKSKKAKISTYLENLVENLKEDLNTYERLKDITNFRYHSLQYILEQSGQSKYDALLDGMTIPSFEKMSIWEDDIPNNYNEELFKLGFLWSHRLVEQDPNESAFQEFKSTGLFSSLRNQNLKNRIISYYKLWDHTIGKSHQEKNLIYVEQWEDSLGEEGLFTSNVLSTNNPLKLLTNKKRAHIAKKLIREAGWIIISSERFINFAEELISEIEEELKK
jgi:hypothetical protein